jgi:hypothetical protein
VIARKDLIAAKLASGRPQDLADVSAIQRAQVAAHEKSARASPKKRAAKKKRSRKKRDAPI